MVSLYNIRLDRYEKNALLHALNGVDDEVYVFGSRLDSKKRGGDIDLVVFSKQNSFVLSRQIAQRFFIHCEEKIDVLVFDRDNLSDEQNAFLATLQLTKIQ